MKRRRIILATVAAVAFATAAGGAWYVRSLGPVPALADADTSTQVLDRHGKLLRAYATPDGRWRLPATVADVDPRFVEMLQAYEDRRFRKHAGVDMLAMGRAAWQLLTHAKVISGGSTLTMQVARLLEPRAERTLAAKLRQIVRAIEIERSFSKDEVLALYLTLAPYGGNLEGIRAASLAYFGKEPKKLSLAEAALLVALPQSPELRRPDRSVAAARAARDRVLDRIAKAGQDSGGRNRLCQAGGGGGGAEADAGARPACRRRGGGRVAEAQGPSPDHRRLVAEEPGGAGARAGEGARARCCRSPSSPSTTRPARCWPASPRPTISTSAAPARST